MPDAIRLWEVRGEQLAEAVRQPLDLEARLESWMTSDVSVLSDDLLVIGRQLQTDAGPLDLLCIDRHGDLIIVELKRDMTPRDVVAQTLDYAAWVVGLSYETVVEYGDAYLAMSGGLEAAFRSRFDSDLPDVLNANHHLLIVASEVDTRSERIIRYLSDTHGVSINAVTFNYFRTADGREVLARTHLIEPDAVEQRMERASTSKRRPTRTMEDHRAEAVKRGVVEGYDRLIEGLRRWMGPYSNKTMVSFYTYDGEKYEAAFNVVPEQSDSEHGLRFNAYTHRLGRAFSLSADQIVDLLPTVTSPWSYSPNAAGGTTDWAGRTGAFRDGAEVERFLAGLAAAPRQPTG